MTVEDTSIESAQEQLEPAYPLRGTGSCDIIPVSISENLFAFLIIAVTAPNDPIPFPPPACRTRSPRLSRLLPPAVEQRALVADPFYVDGRGR